MADRLPSDAGDHPRRLFDALDEGIVVQGLDGTVRDWNAAALRLLALSPAEVSGRAPLPSDWHIVWERAEDVCREGDPLGALFRCARERGSITVGIADGTLRWVTVASHAVVEDQRETVLATITDVTAQRDAERRNERYQQIIDTLDASYRILEESPVGMCSVDRNGVVQRSNMAFLTLAGADMASIFTLLPDEDRGTMRHAFERLMEGGTPSVRLETRIRRPTGTDAWCEITAVAMRQGTPDAAILLLINDVTDRRRRELKLRQLAERDPLTGLNNRRSFLHALRERLASLDAPRRDGGEWALLLIDLDGFKDVNDTCGHSGGDAVLIAVAEAIRGRTRVEDTVGRLGGDEFAVLFRADVAGAVSAGEEMIARIARAAGGVRGAPPVTASIGIVRLRAGLSADETLDAADRAMYRAKRGGKARAVEAAV